MNYEIKSIFELSKGNKEKIKIDWLVKDLISKKNPTIIYGDGGTYKSLIALHLGMVVQEGLPFSNLSTQKANVLLLALEGVEDVVPRAVAHWDEYGLPEIDCFDISRGPFEFGNEEHEKELSEVIKENKIGLLIIDTLSLATVGDISTGTTSGIITRQLRRMCDSLNLTIILIAHTGKNADRGIKGASEFFNNVPTVIHVHDNSISVKKQRSALPIPTLRFSVLPKVINDEEQTSICLVWDHDELNPRLVSILDQLDKKPEGMPRKELFNYVYERHGFKKTKENVRKQFDRDLEKLKKTSKIVDVLFSEDKKDIGYKRVNS